MTRAPLLAALVLILGAALLPLGLAPYGIYLLSGWAVYSIAAVGLNLTMGYAGQVSLAQAAFVGLGAYMTAVLGAYGVPFAVLVVVSAGVGVAVGWCLGYPALRVQHHYLAFVTLAFGTLIWLVLRNEEWLTGGIAGISNIGRPAPFQSAGAYNALCMGALAAVVCAVWWLLRSPWGRAFTALRENATRAASLGVDVRGYTLSAFAIGAGLGGVAGAFYAPLVQYIEPSPFNITFSLNLLLMVIVGGSGTFLGPLVGALVAVLLPEWLRFLQDYYLILYATLVMVLLVFCPSGLLGLATLIAARWRPAVAKSAPVAP
jgi:branched-chain amino acid transport system permease protein